MASVTRLLWEQSLPKLNQAFELDLVTGGIVLFTIMVAAGIVPLIMALKAKARSLRILSLLLGLFAVVHGFYHLAFGFQQDLLADAVFEPISLLLLIGLGAYYSKVGIV
jgi:hypothetical protein